MSWQLYAPWVLKACEYNLRGERVQAGAAEEDLPLNNVNGTSGVLGS